MTGVICQVTASHRGRGCEGDREDEVDKMVSLCSPSWQRDANRVASSDASDGGPRLPSLPSQQTTHLDRAETGAVAGCHVLVAGMDGVGSRELTELLVHVVGTGPRVVSEPDSEVLDLKRLLLGDLSRA